MMEIRFCVGYGEGALRGGRSPADNEGVCEHLPENILTGGVT
jgi:hypothetical protein